MRSGGRVAPLWHLRQLGWVLLGIVLYFGTRGLTAGQPHVAVEHARDVLAVERRLGINLERSSQAAVEGSDWLVDLANWIYIWGHWPVIAVVLLGLALRRRTLYLRLRNGMLFSGTIGLVIFATYPVAPPRLASLGLVDTVTERSRAYRVLQPPAFVNQYAAMPSLHVGWDLLVGLALIAAAGPVVLRVIGVVLPALMASAVVITGNHYVLDVAAGVALALCGHAAALRLERHLARVPQRLVMKADVGERHAPAAFVPAPRRPEPAEHVGEPRRERAASHGSTTRR
jgi:membrane-associated phospholipid phosphatase